jgi:hypothetical protein
MSLPVNLMEQFIEGLDEFVDSIVLELLRDLVDVNSQRTEPAHYGVRSFYVSIQTRLR